MRSLSDADALPQVWGQQYSSLAQRAARLLAPRTTMNILEVGCGNGAFTLPLARQAPQVTVTAIDRFRGPYAPSRLQLAESARRAGLTNRIRVIRGDGLRWIHRCRAGTFQGVVSSEFLPEVTAHEMSTFFRDCLRVLGPGGTTVHLFLSSAPRNAAQRLVIEADSDPRWTRRTPREWFSPPIKLARSLLANAGFLEVRSTRLPAAVRLSRGAALRQLEEWGVRASFARALGIDRGRRCLELPDWVILSGRKAS